ncbi:MAG: NineTeen Complex (NTC) component [Vezdaea aestivalis]|nr:MAG: NineTeen Complex (NTC) component [Vezdaea aestivalis]
MEVSRGPPPVKNKAPAPQQISAEQLLREAVDRQEPGLQAPTQRFADLEELHEYQGRKRKEFEDYVRRNRINMNNWMRYAQWELDQKEYRRARSVFERALDVDSTSVVLWMRYIEAEMMTRNINHARNLLDRAVTILPRVDKLWYKYVMMEETLANVAGTRQVFERWMAWEPNEAAWGAYVKLEKRYSEYDRARAIFERFTAVHPQPSTWRKWANFEQENGTADLVRDVYSSAVDTLGDDFADEKLFKDYARYETKLKEYERARAIYKYGLDRLPRASAQGLHKEYTKFEKQFGDADGVEDVVIAKRRVLYEEEVTAAPRNYDKWFDYAALEETGGDEQRIREVYERAIAQVPPSNEKRHWRKYIYLWLYYAAWEESINGEPARAREIYDAAIKLVPHKQFTFSKLWIAAARAQIRAGDVTAARKILGQALGTCPKDSLFREYIKLETSLFEFGRCRILAQKRVSFNPMASKAWIAFAELERGLDDVNRARAIFELAVQQAELDAPETVWKAYIDLEDDEGEVEHVRKLYERLLQRTNHPKVWSAWAAFELGAPESDEDEQEEEDEAAEATPAAKARARAIFRRGDQSMREKKLDDERVALLNSWRAFEAQNGNEEEREEVQKLMPRRVKKRRKLVDDDSFEEYIAYVFPADDQQAASLSNLLAMAKKWEAGEEEEGGT